MPIHEDMPEEPIEANGRTTIINLDLRELDFNSSDDIQNVNNSYDAVIDMSTSKDFSKSSSETIHETSFSIQGK